jgi:glycosyltransferase involved in cell wall biosynthesis
VADLLAGFRKSHAVELATGEEGYLVDKARDLGIPVHVLRHLRQPMAPLHDAAAVVEFAALVGRLRPDLIHAHTSKAALVARLAGALTRKPVIFTSHTWSFAEGTSRRQRAICTPIERLCAGLSARIVTVSEANRQCAIRAGVAKAQQMTTVLNGVADVPERALPSVGAPVRVVMVARFAEQKDQALLVRAAAAAQGAPVELVFVGDGPKLGAVRSLAEGLQMSRRVIFLGDRDDVPSILSGAHIFALSTKWEGLPLSIIEAMRAGLPVVASDVGGVAELVKDGLTGLTVEPGNAQALTGALEMLISNPDLRSRMGRHGRYRYESCFSYEVMLGQTEQVYFEVLDRRRAVPEGERRHIVHHE